MNSILSKLISKFLLGLLCVSSLNARAQDTCVTLVGDVILQSQAQLDLYWQQNPGQCIDTITGDFFVMGDINDLSGFTGLRYIGGGMKIASTANSQHLKGLDSLSEIDDYLEIRYVKDFSALANLREVGKNIDNIRTYASQVQISFTETASLRGFENLQNIHGCRLGISHSIIADASALNAIDGVKKLSLYQSDIGHFPDMPNIDRLDGVYVFRVSGLKLFELSNLSYCGNLRIDQCDDIEVIDFPTPITFGRYYEFDTSRGFLDVDVEILIRTPKLRRLSADFRRADSLSSLTLLLDVGFSDEPFDCPDFSTLPLNRAYILGLSNMDSFVVRSHNLFVDSNRLQGQTEPSLYTEPNYRLIASRNIRKVVLPDTGFIILEWLADIGDIRIDERPGRGGHYGLRTHGGVGNSHISAFSQLKHFRHTMRTISIEKDTLIDFTADAFAEAEDSNEIVFSRLPNVSQLPDFKRLNLADLVSLYEVPIHQDTLFTENATIKRFLRVTLPQDNPQPAKLTVMANRSSSTINPPRAFQIDNGINIEFGYNNIVLDAFPNAESTANLFISEIDSTVPPQPLLLPNLRKANSYWVSHINQTAIPHIGRLDELYTFSYRDEHGTWQSSQRDQDIQLLYLTDITDGSAVCPIIRGGAYDELVLDENTPPQNSRTWWLNYCDTVTISSTRSQDDMHWQKFSVYPNLTQSGKSVTIAGLGDYRGNLEYRLIAPSGKVVSTGSLIVGQFGRADVITLAHGLAPGEYFIDISSDSGQRGTAIVVIAPHP